MTALASSRHCSGSLFSLALFLALWSAPASASPGTFHTATSGGSVFTQSLPGPVGTAMLAMGWLDKDIKLSPIGTEIEKTSKKHWAKISAWGQRLYLLLFAGQVLLLGITMVVKGPWAIATYRPIHWMNPFANFFFFIIAGSIGFLLVSKSFYYTGNTPSGWAYWIYNMFHEAGTKVACSTVSFGNPCDSDRLLEHGFAVANKLSLASGIGTAVGSIVGGFFGMGGGGGGGGVAGVISDPASAGIAASSAFSILAIQLSITKYAFYLLIFSSPIFMSTVVFKPLSGIANGYFTFLSYISVKLFCLFLVASLAGYISDQVLDGWVLTSVWGAVSGLINGFFGTNLNLGAALGNNLKIMAISGFFIGLTMYLPTKVASMVSGHVNIDLNGVLFHGELPIQIS